MKRILVWIIACFALPVLAVAQTYSVRPSCQSNTCVIVPGTYGYNDTTWRTWPGQKRPDIKDSRAIGDTSSRRRRGCPKPSFRRENNRPPNRPPAARARSCPALAGPSGGGTTEPSRQKTETPEEKKPAGPEGVPGLRGMELPFTNPELTPKGGGPSAPQPKELPSPETLEPGILPLTPPAGPAKKADREKQHPEKSEKRRPIPLRRPRPKRNRRPRNRNPSGRTREETETSCGARMSRLPAVLGTRTPCGPKRRWT